MIYRAEKDDLEEIKLFPETEEQEILQNIAAICETPAGSVPLERELGIGTEHVHMPLNIAAGIYEQELMMAVDKYESRVRTTRITTEIDDDGERLIPTVEVEKNDEYLK